MAGFYDLGNGIVHVMFGVCAVCCTNRRYSGWCKNVNALNVLQAIVGADLLNSNC